MIQYPPTLYKMNMIFFKQNEINLIRIIIVFIKRSQTIYGLSI